MKRVILFLATNFAILIVLGVALSILMPVLGIDSQSNGGLLLMCAVFGMGGSFISLAMSKWIAKRSVGAVVIEQPANQQETWLLDTVKRQANQASIGMPEVAVWDSPEINAFATGMNKNNALVAVSTGLLRTMTKDEAEAVLAHEISHVANGDMVTLALIQGVVNTFVYFFARIAASALSRGSNNRFMYFMTVMFFQFVFGILASTIVMWFSRRREFYADAAGASLAGRGAMIKALQRLQQETAAQVENQMPDTMTAFGISSGWKQRSSRLFMTHPPLEERIEALRFGQ